MHRYVFTVHTHTHMHVIPLILTRHIQTVYADSHKIHTQSMALCEYLWYWISPILEKFEVQTEIHLCPSVHLSLHQFSQNSQQCNTVSGHLLYHILPKPGKTVDNWGNISVISVRRAWLWLQSLSVTKHTIPNQHCMETFCTEFHLHWSRQTKCGINSTSPWSKDWLTELLSWHWIIFCRGLLY